jgi:Ca2+/H+ antiporter
MNGNIALSMEIGSAYALQVCLLQIPAVVFFSAFYGRSLDPSELASHSFKYDLFFVHSISNQNAMANKLSQTA